MDTAKDARASITARRIDILLGNACDCMRLLRADRKDETQVRAFIVALAALRGPALLGWLMAAFDNTRIPSDLVHMSSDLMVRLIEEHGEYTRPQHVETVSFRFTPITLNTAMERWYQPRDVEAPNTRLDGQHYDGSIEYAMVANLVGRSSTTHLT